MPTLDPFLDDLPPGLAELFEAGGVGFMGFRLDPPVPVDRPVPELLTGISGAKLEASNETGARLLARINVQAALDETLLTLLGQAPDVRQFLRAFVRQRFNSAAPRVEWRTGVLLQLRARGRVVDGALEEIWLQIKDVTGRQERESQLLEKNERMQTLLDHLPVALAVLDTGGRVVSANPKALALLGPPGARFEELAQDPLPLQDALAAALKGVPSSVECRAPSKRVMYVTMAPLPESPGEGDAVLLMVEDVTEREGLRRRVSQMRRMEALGRLAGGVAHDFNNLLTVVQSSVVLLQEDLPEGSPSLEDVTAIHAASERGKALTGQLLAFSKRRPPLGSGVDLAARLRDLELLLGRLLGEDVQLRLELPEEPLWVGLEESHLDQIVMNLALNARDAMPRGGDLLIAAREESERVVLDVMDTGEGMSPDVVEHIFEPFFTTKSGGGTGLGLATVHGILEAGGGSIAVRSEVGRGTRFTLTMPVRRPTHAQTPAPDGDPSASPPGLRVLLVEDDALVRRLVVRVLKRRGFSLLVAASAEEALELVEGEDIDLLFSDVVLPGESGPALVQRLRRRRPGLKVLLTSGYPSDTLERHGAEQEPLLPKPFTPEELAAAVERVLGR